MDVRVDGAERLAKVAGAIARNTPNTLRKELLRGMRAAAKPAVKHVKEAAVRDLPHAGGMGQFAKKSTIGVRTRTSGEGAGVRIIAVKKGHDVAAIDRGRLRHPTFGNKKSWHTQSVKPGFFSDTITNERDEMQIEMLRSMDDFLQEIQRDIR